MTLAGIIGAVSGDAADLLACRDLAEQVGQDRCITVMAPGDLDSVDLQCFLINSEMDLAPDPTFRTAVQLSKRMQDSDAPDVDYDAPRPKA